MSKVNKSINITQSNLSNPVIGNNNNIVINNIKKSRKKAVPRYPDGSFGQDVIMYGYAKYLADQYKIFKEYELKRKGQSFNYPAFYGKVKKDFKAGGFFHIPKTRFEELVIYLQNKIDRTILAKINKSKGITKNYTSLEEYRQENE